MKSTSFKTLYFYRLCFQEAKERLVDLEEADVAQLENVAVNVDGEVGDAATTPAAEAAAAEAAAAEAAEETGAVVSTSCQTSLHNFPIVNNACWVDESGNKIHRDDCDSRQVLEGKALVPNTLKSVH